jgi:hypothetical protein
LWAQLEGKGCGFRVILPDTYLARLRVLADDLNVGEEELLNRQ